MQAPIPQHYRQLAGLVYLNAGSPVSRSVVSRVVFVTLRHMNSRRKAYEDVTIVFNIGVRPRDRHLQRW